VALGGCAALGGGPALPGGPAAPYTVLGRTYRPLADWRGFSEEGLASWYDHHGRPTASGEPQDTAALTAAHPVLPMHTCVRVENLENGRSVVVRVNDRGPFVDGRVIDLTPGAARALGILAAGIARVRLRAIAGAGPWGRCPAAAAAWHPGRDGPPGVRARA
jgi:rare lipoprotein A